MLRDKRLLLIYAIVLLDVIVGSASGPVLPQFVAGLPQPQLWLTLGTAVFLGVQVVSAPVLGALSDQLGRRPLVLVSAVGTLVANALLLPIKATFFFYKSAERWAHQRVVLSDALGCSGYLPGR